MSTGLKKAFTTLDLGGDEASLPDACPGVFEVDDPGAPPMAAAPAPAPCEELSFPALADWSWAWPETSPLPESSLWSRLSLRMDGGVKMSELSVPSRDLLGVSGLVKLESSARQSDCGGQLLARDLRALLRLLGEAFSLLPLGPGCDDDEAEAEVEPAAALLPAELRRLRSLKPLS